MPITGQMPPRPRAIASLSSAALLLAALAATSCARRPGSPWKVVQVPTDANFVGAFARSTGPAMGWVGGGTSTEEFVDVKNRATEMLSSPLKFCVPATTSWFVP